MTIHFQDRRVAPGGMGVGVLSYKRPMGMCRWMGSHDWIDLNRVAFLIELLEWGRIFGLRKFFTFTVTKRLRMSVL